MKMNVVLAVAITVFALMGCAPSRQPKVATSPTPKFYIDVSHFAGMDACAIVYDVKSAAIVAAYGEKRCAQRFPACSTFKWPLAVMAFDSGILKDENVLFKWDGVHRSIDSWNQDQTAATWMRNSIVWYSQRLTPMLGQQKIQGYLDAFNYGNRDISAGLTTAWLTVTKSDPTRTCGSLRISAYEQLEFLKKFWARQLPVSADAIAKTTKIVYLETSPNGFSLSGKTGSGYPEDLKGDFGWFIGRVEGHGREYLIVTSFSRDEKTADAKYPGPLAREIAKGIMKDNAVW